MKQILLIILLINSIYYCFSQTILNDPHWELVWEDQFNSGALDENKWLRTHYAQHGQYQIYMEDMVKVESGHLVITVDDESTYCPPNPPTVWGACWPCDNKTYNYTSGWVESRPDFNFDYGLIEARIKLPYGLGFHSSFWTFIGQGESGNAAEIDIFENLGRLPSNVITTNLHTCYPSGQCEPNYYQENNMGNYAYTWHNYAVTWSPSRIVWYVDGNPFRVSNNPGIVDSVRIILNLAIDELPNSSTPFPSEYLVDYVKVHQLKNDCSTNLTIDNSSDFNSLDNRVKNKITIQNLNSTIKVPANSSVYLRSDYKFEIKSNFEVPLGSTFFVDVNSCH